MKKLGCGGEEGERGQSLWPKGGERKMDVAALGMGEFGVLSAAGE